MLPRAPPQGVNSALEDVLVLQQALESRGDRVIEALPEYENLRAADSKALVRVRGVFGYFRRGVLSANFTACPGSTSPP